MGVNVHVGGICTCEWETYTPAITVRSMCSGVTKIVTEVEIRKIVNLYDCVTGVGGKRVEIAP